MTKDVAYGRVGLLGNPSDIYGGKCISFTFSSFAEVEVKDSLEQRVVNGSSNIKSHELVDATLAHLGLKDCPIKLSYRSNIPFGHGLSGSSAIIIAILKTLNQHFSLGLNRDQIAESALHIEVDDLKIAAGFQDRYVISHGGVCYMDFAGKEFMRPAEVDGFGTVERLPLDTIPFFLALSSQPKSSGTVHNPLREQFLYGGDRAREIKYHMDQIAELAELGKDPLVKADWVKVGELMNRNTSLREQISPHNKLDLDIIDMALSYGALGAKVAGSGGAVVVLSDKLGTIEKMFRTYACLKPFIRGYD